MLGFHGAVVYVAYVEYLCCIFYVGMFLVLFLDDEHYALFTLMTYRVSFSYSGSSSLLIIIIKNDMMRCKV